MVKLNISAAQIRALEQGKNINVRPDQIGEGVEVDMDEGQLHRVQKCACSRSGRGVRIGGGVPMSGATFGASLKGDVIRRRDQMIREAQSKAQAGGKLKLPNAKQLKKLLRPPKWWVILELRCMDMTV
jgi:hypothetical protein